MWTKSGAGAAVPANDRLIQLFTVLNRAYGTGLDAESAADAFALVKEDPASGPCSQGTGSASLKTSNVFFAGDADHADIRAL